MWRTSPRMKMYDSAPSSASTAMNASAQPKDPVLATMKPIARGVVVPDRLVMKL